MSAAGRTAAPHAPPASRAVPAALFVYGTLRRTASGGRHPLLRSARLVGAATMAGRLFDLGRYPGAVRDPGDRRRIFGELYEIPDAAAGPTLRTLDEYEGPEFVRRRAYVRLRDGTRRAAWTYVLRGRPPSSARPVATGRYARGRGAA